VPVARAPRRRERQRHVRLHLRPADPGRPPSRALADLSAADDAGSGDRWEKAYLGPKGELTLFLRGLGRLPAEERPVAGRSGNLLKRELEAAWEERHRTLAAADLNQRLAADAIDVTLQAGRRSSAPPTPSAR
jgi:phenylalanyl-tRNA synthetase alpha chain